jgi:xanthine dehydrogenase molybdenum-binding subunit
MTQRLQGLSVVGKSLPRIDGPDKAMGVAEFTADIRLPGMLLGKVLRSPYPHAKIVRIDTSKAEKLPGVEAVITHRDVPKTLFNRNVTAIILPPPLRASEREDEYILSDKARFVGDAIAAVAATSEEIAEEALSLINVEYEELPGVFDPSEAMKPGAPIIHEGTERNIAHHIVYPFCRGNMEQGFREADCVVEETFHASKQKHCQLEPDASIASWDTTGRLTIWSPCQHPHLAKNVIARIFGIGEAMVRWVTPAVGGGFGGRISVTAEPICAALAKKAGKPVKLVYTREEDFIAHESRNPLTYTVKMGVKRDGTITALNVKAITPTGPYYTHGGLTTTVSLFSLIELYRCSNVAAEGYVVYTNTPVSGGMRGYGNPEGKWALEQLIDMACEKIGMDPMEFRLKNHRKAGEPSILPPVPIEQCALSECIELGAQKVGWKEKRGRKQEGPIRRGVGMSIMSHASGGGGIILEHSNALVKVNEDASFNLLVSPCEMGQGILTALGQIAAEELGVAAEDIHIVTGDTDFSPFDIGSHASRSTYVIGNAVVMAARDAKRQLLEQAAKTLGVTTEELNIKHKEIYVKASPEKRISVNKVATENIFDFAQKGLAILGKGSFQSGTHGGPNFQAGFAEVEVNTETGEIKVLKYVVAHDIGRAINPMNVEAQLEGGATQGLGYALYEDFVMDTNTGSTVTDNFTSYKIPTSVDVPEIETIIVEEGTPSGPFGAKGVGEAGMVNVAAAIANALYDAVGIRITRLPITPEKIVEGLKSRKAK